MDDRIFLTEDVPDIFIRAKIDGDGFEIRRYKNTGNSFKQGWSTLYEFVPVTEIAETTAVVHTVWETGCTRQR